jgi:dolichyl-phosphate beta-glucosyltransferase
MLTIVIAAYNEEKRLEKTLRLIDAHIGACSLDAEIIVVNDGSSDGTADILARLENDIPALTSISYPCNRGKGYALRQGVLASRGDLVLLTDADLSTPIEEFEKLSSLMTATRSDIAIGSRALELSRILHQQPWWRRTMGKTFNRIVKAVVLDGFEDTQCGFKLFRGPVARELFPKAVIDRFAYDVEILTLARQKGYRIMEVPVIWSNAPGSKVNPVTDSARMFLDTMRIRFRLGSAKRRSAVCCSAMSHPEFPDTN